MVRGHQAQGGGPAAEDWWRGTGDLQPEERLRLVTLLKKQWMSMKLLLSLETVSAENAKKNTDKSGNKNGVSAISSPFGCMNQMRLLI